MKIGFIGMGNMAKALTIGFLSTGMVKKEEVFAYAPHQYKLNQNAKEIGFGACQSASEVVDKSDLVIFACKPFQIKDVCHEVKASIEGKALLSVALGWYFEDYSKIFAQTRIQCIMPNTPASVSKGVFLFEEANTFTEEENSFVKDLFSKIGLVEVLPTNLIGIGGAISGCGPAFMDLCMEAYADAAVKYGIKREMAYRIVSQTMLGSAALQLETGKHPGVLKDEVCSPGGSTICGVTALEENGFRNACIQSIDAIMNR